MRRLLLGLLLAGCAAAWPVDLRQPLDLDARGDPVRLGALAEWGLVATVPCARSPHVALVLVRRDEMAVIVYERPHDPMAKALFVALWRLDPQAERLLWWAGRDPECVGVPL